MSSKSFKTIIGMEIHARVLSNTKLFSRAPIGNLNSAPNTLLSGFDLSLPGTLPVLNKHCVDQSIKAGLALNGRISPVCVFERKHYFYHDNPSGYQITQYRHPIVTDGQLTVLPPANSPQRKDAFRPFNIKIDRIQLEQDTGKTVYDDGVSLIDLNRAGAPLLEIVTAPCIHGAYEASAFLSSLQVLLQTLGISEAKAENGSLRADINVNVVSEDGTLKSPIVELKNINSTHVIEAAVDYEIKRQTDALLRGLPLKRETRFYNTEKNETFALRDKEEEYDYRIFQDLDLRPLVITPERVEAIKKTLPELPLDMYNRLQSQYQLSEYEASVLIKQIGAVPYFEEVCKGVKTPSLAWGWICNDLLGYLRNENLSFKENPVPAADIRTIVCNLEDNKITTPVAKTLLKKVWETKKPAESLLKEMDVSVTTDNAQIESLCDALFQSQLRENREFVNRYYTGDKRVLPWFVGEILKQTKGKVNPSTVTSIFEQKLKDLKN